ncbi:MAG: ImmA/IrrE family metallo-endopeptidase [Acidobacteria bacterium]|nr:MAG: ImmA/IrrE family metallo-endopeptidase [Acidobacteriota bacterium]
MKRVYARVKPELLVWARESAGLSRDEAAKKVAVKPARLASWEAGERRPTIRQLRKLGSAYKRPIAVFYLPKPPRDFQAMRDFRRLPSDERGSESPALRLEIRRARYRRQVALELLAQLGEMPPPFSLRGRLSDPAEALARRARAALGITHQQQVGWRTPHEALHAWRSAIEQLGVLVFQARGVAVEEMRGFALAEGLLPAIVVNIKDHPHARIFSMVHELTHLMLRRAGLCDLKEEGLTGAEKGPADQRIEAFCNRVAGAVLMPREVLLREEPVLRAPPETWGDDTLVKLAQRYRVSPEAMLIRLLALGKTTERFYRERRRQLRRAYERRQQAETKTTGGPPPDRVAVSTAGPAFVRLVLESFYREKITSADVADYLEVRLKWMPKIEKAVFGRRHDAWALA